MVTQKVLKIFVNCKHDGCYIAATTFDLDTGSRKALKNPDYIFNN